MCGEGRDRVVGAEQVGAMGLMEQEAMEAGGLGARAVHVGAEPLRQRRHGQQRQ